MSTFEPPIAATILPKRSVGPLSATIVLEEVATDELEISQHPVMRGATISDHAYLKPAIVAMKVVFGDADTPLVETYEKLRKLQSDREPIDVVTGKRCYSNMLIKSISQTTDTRTEAVLSVSLLLHEVVLVRVESVAVPERYKQRTPGKTGATESAGVKRAQPEEKKKSALKTLFGG